MSENKSYVIWNNKGGVGKSTLTFHIATEYAAKYTDEDVIVVDMCPQANVSLMLLGENGERHLQKLISKSTPMGENGEAHLQKLISKPTPKTIVGYIGKEVAEKKTPPIKDFVEKLVEINNNLSENLYLITGDSNLELLAPLLSDRAALSPLNADDTPWRDIQSIIKRLTTQKIDEKVNRPCTFFIDTNPSFSIYTQMAIVGGGKMLVPINADDSSIFAIKALFKLIWGSGDEDELYGNYTFSKKAKDFKLELPAIAYLLGNRLTQRKGSAKAFEALYKKAVKTMFDEYKKNPERFVDGSGLKDSKDLSKKFEKHYNIELRDFNSAGVVSSNQGIPLWKMKVGKYEIHGEEAQVNKDQIDQCLAVIKTIVEKL